jgi:hypothetical protein
MIAIHVYFYKEQPLAAAPVKSWSIYLPTTVIKLSISNKKLSKSNILPEASSVKKEGPGCPGFDWRPSQKSNLLPLKIFLLTLLSMFCFVFHLPTINRIVSATGKD